MEKEVGGEWQEISARDRPFDNVGEIENKHHSTDDSDETNGKDDVDESVFLEAKIEIVDTGKAEQHAKQSSRLAALAPI